MKKPDEEEKKHQSLGLEGVGDADGQGAQNEKERGRRVPGRPEKAPGQGEKDQKHEKRDEPRQAAADLLVEAENHVKHGHGPGKDRELHLGEARTVPPPVDPGTEDVHSLPVEIPGDGRVIAFPPRFPDAAVGGPKDIATVVSIAVLIMILVPGIVGGIIYALRPYLDKKRKQAGIYTTCFFF